MKQLEKEIREAHIFLRENNHTIPSDTLQFMLDASLEKLNGQLDTNVPRVTCDEYVEGINMDCARCEQPKYEHIN